MESPIDVAKRFVMERFPDCILAVLGGSANTTKYDQASDLDILVVLPDESDLFRKVLSYSGWLVECTMLTLSDYRDRLDECIQVANPALQRLLTEGAILVQSEVGSAIIREAAADIAYGPMPWSAGEKDHVRYMISDKIMDLNGDVEKVEKWFIVSKLLLLISEFILRSNGQWIADGKHLCRKLREYDPILTDELGRRLEDYYEDGNTGEFIEFCERLLEPYGGLLLDGFEE